MTIWICKLNKSGGQTRITIPKGLVEKQGFFGEGHVYLDDKRNGEIIIRRLDINDKKTVDRKAGPDGEDR